MTPKDKKISNEIDPHSLENVRLKALWVLDNSEELNLTSSTIAKSLISLGIISSRQAVDASLLKKNGAVHKTKKGYCLMEKGRQELRSVISAKENQVIYIEPGKPFTAKSISISSVFQGLSTEVRICDPYIDPSTLDVIFRNLQKEIPIKILTQSVDDKPSGIISRILQDLKKEGFSVELRVNTAGILHDRYIMDRSLFWYSGNSLNGLGKKESLLISLGKDIQQNMSASFDSHWKKATPFNLSE